MFDSLKEDIRAVFERDPAARGVWEVIFCYPGFHAIQLHRIAHWLWGHRLFWLGRFLSHINRFLTGIEIHPGAKIGRGLFIDHGMGVVIGETAEIGDRVTLYHGVTLGGTTLSKDKRHPTLGNNVVVGAGATILGPVRVEENSLIAASSVVIDLVPAHSTVGGVPGKVVLRDGVPTNSITLDHADLPDPVVKAITCLFEQIQDLEARVKELESEPKEGESPERLPWVVRRRMP